jgi:purine nucleosidase
MTPRPIVFDCDTGIDDALALLYLLKNGGELLAAGSVHGNVPAPLGAKNTLRVLEVAGVSGVPVTVGAHHPIAQPLQTAEWVHGDDGLGNTNRPEPTAGIAAGSAAEQIVDLARSRPGEFTLVAVGPLTNLGLALLIEPDLPRLIPEVIIMGGAVSPPGNITATAEANVWHDPEAAQLVVQAPWQLTLADLDATSQTLLSDEHLEKIRDSTTAEGKFAWSILDHYLTVYSQWVNRRTCPLHDPLAVALALDPTLATYRTLPTRIELRGAETRGTTVCDQRPGGPERTHDEAEPWNPIRYVDELDVERFQGLFVHALTS